jgi:carbon-monoxide dehydrogenase medium subunit
MNTALLLLARKSPRAIPLAGGTWLVAHRDPAVEGVVDLRDLNLAYVERRGQRLRLGALTSLQTLVTDPGTRALANGLLGEAAQRHAPRAIRNVATLGGTLVVGEPTCEVLLALIVLDAQVIIRALARQGVSLAAFLANRAQYLGPAGLIVEVSLPPVPLNANSALEAVSRTAGDRPMVNAVALVERKGGVLRSVRLALGGVAPSPIRLPALEGALAGQALDEGVLNRLAREVAATIDPPADSRASAEYRREMAGIVAARALRAAWARAEEG